MPEEPQQKIKRRKQAAPGRITITIAPHEEALREAAFQMRISKSEVIRQALSEFLEKRRDT